MKLIIGLGNIGEKYLFTRHNAGFMAADMLAQQYNFSFKEDKKLKCFIAKAKIFNDDFIIIKPTTYMNLSGEALRAVIDYYKVNSDDILVIYDDLSLDLGRIRFRPDGSDGGHNGIKSIIQHLGSKKFARLKIGIGPQSPLPSEYFVLEKFTDTQLTTLKETLKTSLEAIAYYFENGMAKTQNKFN